ncbi:MAG TPA: ABC transporter permease [Dehalococcoidales bacterium]|nr:ABC transporter permease [Dehalococcoidales bacterium]
MYNFFMELAPAIQVEYKKALRSRTLWITALAFALLTAIDGLFMYILKDPEQARRLGLLGAKAQFLGGTADWQSYFNLMLILMSVGCLIIFGFVFTWVFGREFSDKTVYDWLALPVSRTAIVAAKMVTALYWSAALTVLVFALMLALGAWVQLPGWSSEVVWHGMGLMAATAGLSAVLCLPFSMVASLTRGYLPAIGAIFLVMILSQVITQLGNGQYFPWTVPLLFSGAAEALSGKAAEPLGVISYILVAAVTVICAGVTFAWWRYADQT